MRRADDRGFSVLEVVLVLPLLLLVLLFTFQGSMTAVTGVAAQNAARSGARAAGLGRDGARAALGALNEELRPVALVTVTRGPGQVSTVVVVRTRRVVPLVPEAWLTVSRAATFPAP